MFVLDTDVVSNLRKKKPHPQLIRWMDDIGWEDLATTVLTIMEIQIGIERARRADAPTAEHVQQWLAGRNFLLQDTVSKKTKTGADLAIASIAFAHSAVVVTGNRSDFLAINQHFPLPGLYDPFEGEWVVKPPAV